MSTWLLTRVDMTAGLTVTSCGRQVVSRSQTISAYILSVRNSLGIKRCLSSTIFGRAEQEWIRHFPRLFLAGRMEANMVWLRETCRRVLVGFDVQSQSCAIVSDTWMTPVKLQVDCSADPKPPRSAWRPCL